MTELLRAADARISVDGRAVLGPVTVVADVRRLVVAGDVAPLLAVLMNVPLGARASAASPDPTPTGEPGFASVSAGVFAVDGASAPFRASVGAAVLDAPLPLDATALAFIRICAEAADLGRLARARAAEVLELVGLAKAGSRHLRSFALPERRALALAQAALGSPRVIVAEAPLANLDGPGATFVFEAFARVTEGRKTIASVGRFALGTVEGTLIERAEHVLYFSRGELVLSGKPTEILGAGSIYGITVKTEIEAFRAALAAAGIELAGGPERFTVTLPAGKDTRVVLEAAASARAAVVELLALM